MNEDEARVYTLVPSRNRGRYGLDEQDGGDLTTGQHIAILLGGRWTPGRVEHSTYPSQKYPDGAGCYALTGMEQIRCSRCQELLHWSEQEHPPTVHFDTRTGRVRSVTLMRFCLACGYKEIGQVSVNRDPLWTEQEEEGERHV